MDRILAYELKQLATQVIDMPLNAQVLTVQDAQGSPTLYALTQDGQEVTAPHIFHAIRTSMPFTFERSWRYIGTYQVPGFSVAWNIFEEHPMHRADLSLEAIEKIIGGKVKVDLETAIEVITDPPPGKPVNVRNLPKGGEWANKNAESQETSILSPRGRWETIKASAKKVIEDWRKRGDTRNRILVNG